MNTTKTTNQTAAGIAVACDGVVYGVGDTFTIARSKAVEFSDGANVPREMPLCLRSTGWVAFRVTGALRQQIETGGASDGYRLIEGTDYLADVIA